LVKRKAILFFLGEQIYTKKGFPEGWKGVFCFLFLVIKETRKTSLQGYRLQNKILQFPFWRLLKDPAQEQMSLNA